MSYLSQQHRPCRSSNRAFRRKPQLQARIEMLCAQRGWNVSDLARTLGVSRQYLNHLLRTVPPRRGSLSGVAAALGVEVAALLLPVDPCAYGRAMMGDD